MSDYRAITIRFFILIALAAAVASAYTRTAAKIAAFDASGIIATVRAAAPIR